MKLGIGAFQIPMKFHISCLSLIAKGFRNCQMAYKLLYVHVS